MKAVVYRDYGGPEVLRLMEVEKPTPAEDQILVKVHAAAVNPLDWHFMRGTPYLMRLASGVRKPKSIRLGADYSGTVEAVGSSVTRFKVGDAVFGGGAGALAEYLAASADGGVLKPETLTFEQAAAVNVAGRTALQALRRKAQVQPGQKVLINGASGGVGTFAVQIAKAFGAEVTGVQSTRNLELVQSLGADHVIDYTKHDFTTTTERYDVIIDNIGNRSLADVRRVLNPAGKYVLIGGGGPEDHKWVGPLGRIVQMLVVSPFVRQDVGFFLASTNRDDLQMLADLTEAGRITPVIDRRYPFTDAAEAISYLESGHARGKVVVTFA
jgi:NADPH:quinone reductase-like Zn-dependent oxidoreductase